MTRRRLLLGPDSLGNFYHTREKEEEKGGEEQDSEAKTIADMHSRKETSPPGRGCLKTSYTEHEFKGTSSQLQGIGKPSGGSS